MLEMPIMPGADPHLRAATRRRGTLEVSCVT